MTDSMNRRDFIKFTASAAAMLGLAGMPGVVIAEDAPIRKPKPIAEGKKIRIAQIGFYGKGSSDLGGVADEDIVALCDVDWGLTGVQSILKKYPNAKHYKDFRKMLIEMDDQIDAVQVSTPDHMHFLPAYMAISMGKHVFVQKPLTQTIWEARELLRMAKLHGVCTQMGNQGHQGEGIRLVKEWIEAGVIGDVTEVQVWTNRPIWPQGMQKRPDPQNPPAGLDWELFLGRAPERPYNEACHPKKWRGWVDYGCGALGDMGCHTLDAAFYALNLGEAKNVTIQAEVSAPLTEAYPAWSIINFEFPARGKMPAVKLTWRDGTKIPPRPSDLEENRKLSGSGQYYVGAKGQIYDGTDYCNSPRVIPETKMQQLDLKAKVPKTIRRPEPIGNPHTGFLQAIRKGDPQWATSNFEYAAALTEFVSLGNVALRAPGKKLEWDAEKMAFTNAPELTQYLKPTFRPNWAPEELKACKRQGTEDLTMPAVTHAGSYGNEKPGAKVKKTDAKKGPGKKGQGKDGAPRQRKAKKADAGASGV